MIKIHISERRVETDEKNVVKIANAVNEESEESGDLTDEDLKKVAGGPATKIRPTNPKEYA